MGDDNILPFPAKRRGIAIDGFAPPAEPRGTWEQITIAVHDDFFVVCVWTGQPGPGVQSMTIGIKQTLLAASALAQRKAQELGVDIIRDYSDLSLPEPDGPTAA